MNLATKKWAPWNWFKSEDKQSEQTVAQVSNHPVQQIHNNIDRVFNQFFNEDGLMGAFSPISQTLLKPSVDIGENKKNYLISIEVPGVDKEDINLELVDHDLVISGEKKNEIRSDEDSYHCVERSYGYFKRVISLPEDADKETISADFKNGILKITVKKNRLIPKKQNSKRIAIS